MTRRYTICTFVLILLVLLSGCAQGSVAIVTNNPAADQTANNQDKILEPQVTEQISPAPTPGASNKASVSPVNEEQSSKPITNAPEDYIFRLSYEEQEKYNAFFEEEISIDLDGDGEKETIKLIPEDKKTIEDEQYFKSIRISVNDKEIEVSAEPDWNLGFDNSNLYAVILDIDKGDKQKEVMIYEQKDVVTGDDKIYEKAVVLTYKNGQPQIALGWGPPVEANGTGYVVYTDYSKILKGGYSIGLQGVKYYSLATGFNEIGMKRYRTITYTAESGESAVETVRDQMVSQKPGGKEDILIPEDSNVYFGLYDPLGWIEVYSSDGEKLGWLDLNKVDIDAYIGYALEASCH